MSNNGLYLDALEYYVLDNLNCTLEQLHLLEQVYSNLANMCEVDVSDCLNNLNNMLAKTYKIISQTLAKCLRDTIISESEIEVVDKPGNGWITYKLNDTLQSELLKICNDIEHSKIDCSNLNEPKFNSPLDKIIDFYEGIDENTDYLLQYIMDNLVSVE